ncbi:FAD-binding oxidoreductase [Actinoallomurus bryophytorum]|uniref:FAD/FMN-containing dehydrogenase n=1 Tax=Actinoallomurus bryophytorum TaxID=1490222 RepID=A0A543CGQ0_9ACTN|nr:FAD-binding oxidoreductase [Actinoallomurus bryophytorum]TQL96283.1 FAD/FMN-containing dehydrogenase [Actinoallomurus bryophytorum]
MSDSDLETLAARVRGPVLRPGDDDYDGERRGFQTGWCHEPTVIVGATGADDVRAAVAFAAARDLPVAVQATGHGLSVAADGGVLISTRRMTGVRVDAAGRTAWIEAGVRWRQVIDEVTPYGLAPLNGSAPDTGAVSYTLGGGLGLLARRHGYAADHVTEIDVVTAGARQRHVTAETDPDLFWALRGGRDNFGVVTGMRIGLVPVTRIYGGGLFFPAESAAEVLGAFAGWTRTLPEELTASVGMVPLPDLPVIPEPIRGRHVVHVRVAHLGDAVAGERLVAPLRAAGPCLLDTLAEMPYAKSDSIYNDPPGPHAYSGTNVLLSGLDEAAVKTVAALAGPDAPVPCVVDLRHLGGALARTPAVPSAVAHWDAPYLLRLLSPLDGLDRDTVRAAHRHVYEAMEPWTTGGRVLNFIYGDHATADEVRAAYEPGDHRRLTELKAVHDPANLFRLNPNIPPA